MWASLSYFICRISWALSICNFTKLVRAKVIQLKNRMNRKNNNTESCCGNIFGPIAWIFLSIRLHIPLKVIFVEGEIKKLDLVKRMCTYDDIEHVMCLLFKDHLFVTRCVEQQKNKSPPTYFAKALFIYWMGDRLTGKTRKKNNKNMTYRQQLSYAHTFLFDALQNLDQIIIFVTISREIHFVDCLGFAFTLYIYLYAQWCTTYSTHVFRLEDFLSIVTKASRVAHSSFFADKMHRLWIKSMM